MKNILCTIILLSLFSASMQAGSADSTAKEKPKFFNALFKKNVEDDSKKKQIITTTLADGSIYTGTLKKRRPHGNGRILYKNGNKYTGEFSKGQCHGKGVFEAKNGEKYEGSYYEGKRHGSTDTNTRGKSCENFCCLSAGEGDFEVREKLFNEKQPQRLQTDVHAR